MLNVSKGKGEAGISVFGNCVHMCTLVHSVLQMCTVRGWIRISYRSINNYKLALRNQKGHYRIR